MNIELWQFIVGILIIIGGLLGTAMRVGFVVASAIAKINEQMATDKAEFHALLELKESEAGEKIGRVYQRFDEYKTSMEANFVRREMCSLMHNGTTEQLNAMAKKLDINGEKLDALILKVAGMK
jgi:hypothetical protein